MLPPETASGAISSGNVPELNPSLLKVSTCLPAGIWIILGVIPDAVPSTLKSAPCGTEFTVIEINFGGRLRYACNSAGSAFGMSSSETIGPEALM